MKDGDPQRFTPMQIRRVGHGGSHSSRRAERTRCEATHCPPTCTEPAWQFNSGTHTAPAPH
jgi:hypothetical protein